MKKFILPWLAVLGICGNVMAQDSPLEISGELRTDQRFLLQEKSPWAWNENRLTLELEKRITGQAKFHSQVWLRNIGLPKIITSSNLYNKGIIDPYNLEIREAYVQLTGFIFKNLDGIKTQI